jgi:short-subunit dehydrogenase
MKQPIALITGATAGIGRTTALELARRGYRVFGTSRKPPNTVDHGIELLPLDITDAAAVQACVTTVLERAGQIDLLINNVGAMLFGAAEEVSPAELTAHLDLNFLGATRMIQAILPAMRAQRRGAIINISSLGGLAGLPYLTAYTASKFALEGYSEALRLELLPLGIYVSLVEPGGARTNSLDRSQQRAALHHPAYADATDQFMAKLRADQERNGLNPERVAHQIAAIASARRPRLRYVVGSQARLVTTLKRFLPQAWYETMVQRQMALPPAMQPAPTRTNSY